MVMYERGAIVIVSGGLYASKPRPVLIVQDPELETGNSVVIIPFTSTRSEVVSFRVAVGPTEKNGLDRNCWLEVDKVSAIRRSFIDKAVGSLEAKRLLEVEEALRTLLSLGLG
jgi:mRNA interferase MazF